MRSIYDISIFIIIITSVTLLLFFNSDFSFVSRHLTHGLVHTILQCIPAAHSLQWLSSTKLSVNYDKLRRVYTVPFTATGLSP